MSLEEEELRGARQRGTKEDVRGSVFSDCLRDRDRKTDRDRHWHIGVFQSHGGAVFVH